MTTPQLSTYPFIAHILFKDGTSRRVDYTKVGSVGVLMAFFIAIDGETVSETVCINPDAVQTIDLVEAAKCEGRA